MLRLTTATLTTLLVGGALSYALMAGPDEGPGPAGAPPAEVVPESGHERMVEILARIAEEKPEYADYRMQAAPLVHQLSMLPEEAPVEQRVALSTTVGQVLMRMDVEAAIPHLEKALELAAGITEENRFQYTANASFWLAVAHLRRGLTVNCLDLTRDSSCLLPIGEKGAHRRPAHARKAVPLLEHVLQGTPPRHPMHVASKWLLTIASMAAGDYPQGIPEAHRVPPEVFESDAEFPRFRNVAEDAGLAVLNYAGGVAVDDFDGDGLLDVVTSSMASDEPLRLFVNQGNGRFEERTSEAGLTGILGGLNVTQADYDGDGDLDLLVLRGAWLRSEGRIPNSLLENDGRGRFTDVTFEAGLGDVHYPTQVGRWADYDLDGDLDLFVGNEAGPWGDHPSQLFRNNGDATFTDVAAQAGVENRRWVKGAAWSDYDGDRYPDLYVSNNAGHNRLYKNNRNGTFRETARELGVLEPIGSFSTWFWDADEDGRTDLFVNGYQAQRDVGPGVWYVAAARLGLPQPVDGPRLFLGTERGGLADATERSGLDVPTLPMGSGFGDLDNDGWLDFYLGTGYPGYEGLIPNVMYRNQGGGRFVDVTFAGGFGHLAKGHGIAFADVDGDGDQDVFSQLGGMNPDDAHVNALFENPGFGHHWVTLRLRGRQSNRYGVGARLRLDVSGECDERTIHREITSGSSFGGNPLRAEIGLGDCTRIDRLEITWPTPDHVQVFRDVAVDRFWLADEGSDHLRELHPGRNGEPATR